MKLTKVFVAVLLLLAGHFSVSAQGFRVPEDYSFSDKESYHKYDKTVIKFANWLEKVAPGDEEGNVKKGTRFLLEWMSGSTYVHFKQNVRIDNFMGDSPQYRIYYMAGWVRYALKNGENADRIDCTFAGIKMMLKVYKENRSDKKDANLDELVKQDEKGRLRKWIEEHID